METLTVESWRVHACNQACDELRGGDMAVTFAADKQMQLTQLRRFDAWLRSMPHVVELAAKRQEAGP